MTFEEFKEDVKKYKEFTITRQYIRQCDNCKRKYIVDDYDVSFEGNWEDFEEHLLHYGDFIVGCDIEHVEGSVYKIEFEDFESAVLDPDLCPECRGEEPDIYEYYVEE